MRNIAALYVQKDGSYYGLPGVDPWDEERNAMLYDGPDPVVAHPPCARWCQLAGLVEARYGYKRGDDGGTFAAALEAVRRFGGVLEHPAYSSAWAAHGLAAPPTGGGWQRDLCGGWSCYIEQASYGHRARKATWLYIHGAHPPLMRFGRSHGVAHEAVVSGCANNTRGDGRPRLFGRASSATPVEFRDILIAMARSAP